MHEKTEKKREREKERGRGKERLRERERKRHSYMLTGDVAEEGRKECVEHVETRRWK